TEGIMAPSHGCSSLNTSYLHPCISTVADDLTAPLPIPRASVPHRLAIRSRVRPARGPELSTATDPVRRPDPLWRLPGAPLPRKTANPPALAVWNAPGVTGKSVEVVKPGINQCPLPSSQEPAPT